MRDIPARRGKEVGLGRFVDNLIELIYLLRIVLNDCLSTSSQFSGISEWLDGFDTRIIFSEP